MVPFIKDLQKQTAKLLADSQTVLSFFRYKKLLVSLNDVSKEALSGINKGVKEELQTLATYEAGFTNRLVNNLSDIPFETVAPTASQLKTAAFSTILDGTIGFKPENGVTVQQALTKFGAKQASSILQAVRTGFALGQTSQEIAGKIATITSTVIPRQAQTLAQTITSHVASTARSAFYEANIDIITSYQVVATLDDRCCIECAVLDGRIFSSEEFETPPYHFNCRCTFIGVVDKKFDKGSEETGTRPAKGDEGVESVSTQSNYNSWLKNQNEAFQNEVLGSTRGDLFRAGAHLDKFVDHNYVPYTVADLKKQDDLHVFFTKIK